MDKKAHENAMKGQSNGGHQMTLARLIDNLNQIGILPAIREEAAGAHLHANSPAKVNNDGSISILNTLNPEEKELSIAHELGHILVRNMGVLQIEQIGGPEDYLFLEINNALSHSILIELLERQYGIGSAMHLNLRLLGLTTMENNVTWAQTQQGRDAQIFLAAEGVKLYDIHRTIPHVRADVQDLIRLHPVLSLSFERANEFFSGVNVGIGLNELHDIITKFLNSVGIPIRFDLMAG